MQFEVHYRRNTYGHLTSIALVDADGVVEDVYVAEEADALLDGVREYFGRDPYCDKLPSDKDLLEYIQQMDNLHARIGCL